MKKGIETILNIIMGFMILIIIVLSIEIVKIEKDKSYIPSFLGYTPLVVLSNSMNPLLQKGDIIVIKKVSDMKDMKENDIITFKNKEQLITHRIVKKIKEIEKIDEIDDMEEIKEIEEREDVFITKGDANKYSDQYFINEEDIIGKYCFSIKRI